MDTGRETVQTFSDNVQPQLESPAAEQRKALATAPEKQDLSGNIPAESRSEDLREKKERPAPSRTDQLSTTGSASTLEQSYAASPATAPLADAEGYMRAGEGQEALIVWGTITQEVPAVSKAVEADNKAVMKDKGVFAATGALGKATRRDAVQQQHTFIIGQTQRGGLGQALTPGHSGTMPARLFRSADTMYVTLLLDTLLTPAEIRSAYVRECTADSFQVILPGGTTIGVRSPFGLAR
jgi:hypothetical protein